MTLADLSHLAAPHVDNGHDTAWTELRDVLEQGIANDPRSQQTRIGPSEIGDPCDRCLVSKLAGVPEARDTAWLPFIGTATHAAIADIFAAANSPLEHVRWLIETTVSVGHVDGVDITGHADLYDAWTATVWDWKIVGATTLRQAKATGPSDVYRIQRHLYGRGFTRRGLPVRHVGIAYLPRNAVTLSDAVIDVEPYDEQVAVTALARADMFAAAIRTFGADTVLASVPNHAGGYGCARRSMPGRDEPRRRRPW